MSKGISLLLTKKKNCSSGDGLKIIDNLLQKKFSEIFTNDLKSYVCTKFACEVLGVKKGEFQGEYFYSFKVDLPAQCKLNLSINRKTVEVIVALLFGGDIDLTQEEFAPITKLEQVAVRKVLHLLINSINGIFFSAFNKNIIIGYEEKFSKSNSSDFKERRFSIIIYENEEGLFELQFSDGLIQYIYDEKCKNLSSNKNVDLIQLGLSVSLNKKRITIGALKNLSVGGFLNFDSDVYLLTDLNCLYKGKVGCIGSKKAMKIE